MEIVSFLESLHPWMETPLGLIWGEPLTVAGTLIVAFWIVFGLLLARYSGRLVIAYERARGINDEQVLNISRVIIGTAVLLASILVGLDMGGPVSVVDSTRAIYLGLRSVLGYAITHREEVPITVGGLLSVGVWLYIGRKLAPRGSALLLRLLKDRDVDDERIHRLVQQLSQGIVTLACIGVGLDMGGLVTIDESFSSFFSLFTSSMFTLGDRNITVTTLLTVAAVIAGSFYISRIARAALRPALELRLSSPQDAGTVSVIDRLTHYLVVAIGIVISLQTAGLDLSALLATGAAFAVGLSLAMQTMAQNFISGLILLLERAIRPGDILELDGEPVRVVRIGIRSTVVKTLNDEDRIVPNASLVDNAITNYSYSDQTLRVRVGVGVAYESDLKAVLASLERAARSIKHLPELPPRIQLHGFGASSVDFEVSIWIRDPWRLYEAASELRLAIWWALKEDNITISFPQLDVHFDGELPEPLKLVPPKPRDEDDAAAEAE